MQLALLSPIFLDVCTRCALVWFDPAEFAALFRISRRTLQRYLAAGQVPCVRLSKRLVRIPVSAIRRLEERRAAA